MTARRYLEILQNFVDKLYKKFPQDLANMWFQQERAPSDNPRNITDHFNHQHENDWIGNRGLVDSPARSPALTPLDFCDWGYLKDKVDCIPH